MNRLKYKFYIIWAVFNFIFGVLSYLFMIETAGKSLEEIDGIFERNRGWIARSEEERTKLSLGGVTSAIAEKTRAEVLGKGDMVVEHMEGKMM